jgi:hypothetical protein
VDKIEYGWRAGNLPKRCRIPCGCCFKIRRLNRHGKNLLGTQGRLQAFPQVSEISVWVSRWCHALVDLRHVDVLPGNFFPAQRTQHYPRSVAPADRNDEATTGGNRCSSFGSNESGSLSRD